MSVHRLVTTRGRNAILMVVFAASFLIGVNSMALGGFGLNPFADIAHLGNNIGSVFGSPTEAGASIPVIGQAIGSALPEPTNYGTSGITRVAGPSLNVIPLNSTQSSPTSVLGANTGAGGIAPAGTVGAGMNQSEYLNGIQQEYGNAIQGYTGEKANAMAANPVNLQDVSNVYDRQKNVAQSQADNQINTYNTQRGGIESQQALSLAQLADQIRGQHQGLQAQLGASGAGSSSASMMGDYALSHLQNQNAASINTQAGGNIANVNAQIQQVHNTLDPYLQSLEGQKQQQLHSIMSNYNDLMAKLESSIGQAQGEEKARLAYFGQTLTQAAQDSIAQLNGSVAQQQQAYLNSIQGAKNNIPGYQAPAMSAPPAPVTAPTLSPFQTNTGAANATSTPGVQGGSLAAILKQQQQNAIA